MRYVKCSPASTASPRKFERVRCKQCSKSFHSTNIPNFLRVHVSTVQPKEYAKSPGLTKYHREPYHKQTHSGAEQKDKKADPHRPAHASTRAAERSLSPPAHTGDPYSKHGSTRRESNWERRDHRRHTASYSGNTAGAEPRQATKPAWLREMSRKMAEAAGHK